MNLNELYKSQNGTEFWQYLGKWKYTSFSKQQKTEIDSILEDLMYKVKENFDLIYQRLENINYNFFDKEEARVQPTDDVEERLDLLSKYVAKGGLIPLSLRKFYTIVGGVDFMKKYNCTKSYPITNDNYLPDPAVIPYLSNDFLDYVKHDYSEDNWEKEELEEYIYKRGIPLAPDIYHKNNYSGGEPYSIKLSKHTVIDNFFPCSSDDNDINYAPNNLFGFESNNWTFIYYLRDLFHSGGFPEMEEYKEKQSKKDRKKINEFVNYLKEGLKEI